MVGLYDASIKKCATSDAEKVNLLLDGVICAAEVNSSSALKFYASELTKASRSGLDFAMGNSELQLTKIVKYY
ncbi:hypothetical protein [Piscirickettsia salmonis]|uniref:hypothetical protein n=1 Tax=Piscirickettsia salmonis TaxID=1238 RepID=UPI003A80BA8C